jgi:hypothetical protein
MADIPLEDIIVKGAFLTVLIPCTGVWFAGSKYGLSWKAVQIRADKLPDSIRGFAFLDDGDDVVVAGVAAPTATQVAVAKRPVTNQFENLVDDDEVDDEEALAPASSAKGAAAAEEDDDDAVEEPPAPVPPKKTTVTKKVVVASAKKMTK